VDGGYDVLGPCLTVYLIDRRSTTTAKSQVRVIAWFEKHTLVGESSKNEQAVTSTVEVVNKVLGWQVEDKQANNRYTITKGQEKSGEIKEVLLGIGSWTSEFK